MSIDVRFTIEVGRPNEIESTKNHTHICIGLDVPDFGKGKWAKWSPNRVGDYQVRHASAAAGQLARLAIYAEPFTRPARQIHKCVDPSLPVRSATGLLNPPGPDLDVCGVVTTNLLSLHTAEYEDMGIIIVIQSERLPRWQERINAWLSELRASSDMAQWFPDRLSSTLRD